MKTKKHMIPFQVYRSNGHKYLAVTSVFGLRIEGRKLSRALYRVGAPELIEGTDVKLIINDPKVDRENQAFRVNIASAREHWKTYGMTRSLKARQHLYHSVLACCSYFDKKTLKQHDLRDIAQLIGIKSNRTFYHVLNLEVRRQLNGRPKAIAQAKDITIIQSVNNFRTIWPSIHGFSKKLNSSFSHELNLYISAMKARSLRVGG